MRSTEKLKEIMARTEARAVEGIDRAIERVLAFVEAGTDVTFVEAPLDLNELSRIPKVGKDTWDELERRYHAD